MLRVADEGLDAQKGKAASDARSFFRSLLLFYRVEQNLNATFLNKITGIV
jgi:hypothetical protein